VVAELRMLGSVRFLVDLVYLLHVPKMGLVQVAHGTRLALPDALRPDAKLGVGWVEVQQAAPAVEQVPVRPGRRFLGIEHMPKGMTRVTRAVRIRRHHCPLSTFAELLLQHDALGEVLPPQSSRPTAD
jgi:hypothetical protein